VKFKRLKPAPVLLAAAVLALVCGLRLAGLDFFERLERMTSDLRARTALHFPAPVTTNLAFVAITDDSIKAVQNGFIGSDPIQKIGLKFGLYWPREVYGRLVNELGEQGAQTVAFDILFSELRSDHPSVHLGDGSFVENDDYFARQMRRTGNVILADTGDAPLPDLFVTNALALGDVTTEKDSDGVLRHVRAFRDYRRWHSAFRQVEADPGYGIDLTKAKVEAGQIILPRSNGEDIKVPIDGETNFDLAAFDARLSGKAKAFTDQRVWQMGIVLAARELKLDLKNAEVDLPGGEIVLPGAGGVERTIPVDRDGYFYIDWRLEPNNPRLWQAPIERLLAQNFRRLDGQTSDLRDDFRGKIVVVGSTAQGSDLTDRGATPLQRDTFLVTKHLNIANSVITGQFIRRASLSLELALICLLGVLTALLARQRRAFSAVGAVFLLTAIYVAIAFYAFGQFRVWLPVVLPIFGAILTLLLLVAYRVVFEEGQKRHVKSVFSKIVSPDVVNELLQAEKLSLGGGRQEVTIWFADVRGFTEFTDQSQAKVLEYIRSNNLSGAEAEAAINEEARETLATVNLYLCIVADSIKKHSGTLDKYVGDCAMAFWNAPLPHPKHAAACVRAAIDAQRAIYDVNRGRAAENHKRELENVMLHGGARPKSKLAILTLGSGINTGVVTVGLMGSDEHLFNYTVFGREVNLASRLESVSGRSRIIISEATYGHLQRDDPELAATCVALPPVKVKGIAAEVKIYEVPWRPPGAAPFDEELFSGKPAEGTSFTGLIQRDGR
jgi:class 3 adenylate cyclase/CHASE2 domain-containing sensor protein